MSSALKILGILVATVVAVAIFAAIIFMLVFDANDYKDDISEGVRKATGRELVALFVVAATSVAAADDLAGEFLSFPGACRSAGLRAAAARGRLVTLQRRLSRFGGEIQWTRVGLTGPVSRMEFADTGPF